jgi:hypothetical protein
LDVRSLARVFAVHRLYLGQTAAVSACGLTDILSLIADIRLRGRPDIAGLCRDVWQVKAKVFEEITAHYGARQGGRQARVRPFISRPCQQHFRVSSIMMASQRVLTSVRSEYVSTTAPLTSLIIHPSTTRPHLSLGFLVPSFTCLEAIAPATRPIAKFVKFPPSPPRQDQLPSRRHALWGYSVIDHISHRRHSCCVSQIAQLMNKVADLPATLRTAAPKTALMRGE